ncbi:hypothetical protein P175DRAFT_0499062 [Aspergillus ochraceoroseus IBT 24754]|uniref:WAP domain-containing protein n=1 Tax=Aspergillus ochraceoroseus IBT 24754 TaxID=1392256 RepID=A0A2T5M1X1_9EURO|nr:uncharacterized protein P175DRAFT_0499062 [Aspergillus ochraceoroseus IBT 24754]PTU22533.1 hypothetical protein P175DRAFT_0499062 [Aspergillus ochraceoroseus IBT 24754]
MKMISFYSKLALTTLSLFSIPSQTTAHAPSLSTLAIQPSSSSGPNTSAVQVATCTCTSTSTSTSTNITTSAAANTSTPTTPVATSFATKAATGTPTTPLPYQHKDRAIGGGKQPDPKNECNWDQDCDTGYLCDVFKCRVGCRHDSGCLAGQVCRSNICVLGANEMCYQFDRECKRNDQCCSGRCRRKWWIIGRKRCKHDKQIGV